MSFSYCVGNQAKAARIARQIVKPLDVTDVECVVSGGMKYPEEHHKLYTAIRPDYAEMERRYHDLWDRLKESIDSEEVKKMLGELSDAEIDLRGAREMAWFHLGFAAALRLMGAPPDMHVVNGGNAEPKTQLKGMCSL